MFTNTKFLIFSIIPGDDTADVASLTGKLMPFHNLVVITEGKPPIKGIQKILPKDEQYEVNHENRMIIPNTLKPFKCPHSFYEAPQKYYLNRHLLVHKNDAELEKFKCQYCSFSTIHRSNVKKHLVMHKSETETEIFKCTDCPFTTKRKSTLKQHFQRHTLITFTCEYCNQTFNTQNNLTKHKRTHNIIPLIPTRKYLSKNNDGNSQL